jgi:chromosome segregation ATPase
MEAQIQQLSDRLTQLEQAQAAARRNVVQAAATVNALRGQLQRFQGAMQKIRRQVPRGPTEREQVTATRLTNVETRLRALQKQLRVTS